VCVCVCVCVWVCVCVCVRAQQQQQQLLLQRSKRVRRDRDKCCQPTLRVGEHCQRDKPTLSAENSATSPSGPIKVLSMNKALLWPSTALMASSRSLRTATQHRVRRGESRGGSDCWPKNALPECSPCSLNQRKELDEQPRLAEGRQLHRDTNAVHKAATCACLLRARQQPCGERVACHKSKGCLNRFCSTATHSITLSVQPPKLCIRAGAEIGCCRRAQRRCERACGARALVQHRQGTSQHGAQHTRTAHRVARIDKPVTH
jgi:hypothetical protein